MVQFYKNPHNSPAFWSDMVTSGAGDFFDQSVLAQFLQGAAGFGTALLRILYAGENSFSDIPVPEAVYQIPAVTDRLHDTQYIGRPYIKAGDMFSFDGFP